MSRPFAFILCEGYRDRAFWKGWLKHMLGASADLGAKGGPKALQLAQLQPYPGEYVFEAGARLIRVVCAHGDRKVWTLAGDWLREDPTRPVHPSHVLINVDSDDSDGTRASSARDRFSQVMKNNNGQQEDQLWWRIGSVRVFVVPWETDHTTETSGVPRQQTLERIACTAIAAAHPSRASAVHEWLTNGRGQDAPMATHKHHAWSYMAGWHAENECDFFYERLWDDDAVRPHLEDLLRNSGATAVVQSLVSAP